MILVDTSVGVDFFRGTERAADLAEHLESNLVLLHPWVLGELVLGGLAPRRSSVIADLKRLPAAPLVPDEEVIFETLNARGEPLLPADLLRNYIFLRAARHGEDPEILYSKYWRNFDDPFWREEVRQGQLSRPRSDLYMQHFLTGRLGTDIPIKHLFVEYKKLDRAQTAICVSRRGVGGTGKARRSFSPHHCTTEKRYIL